MDEQHIQEDFSARKPAVCVLLATYNGERFLKWQLDSLAAQSGVDMHVYVSDDGSSDGTLEIARQYQTDAKLVITDLSPGPGKGFAENFRYLIQNASTDADYYCFCDQDDVWLPDKIARSARALSQTDQGKPALYCGRTALIDEYGRRVGFSPLFTRPASFRNALVQSLAGGNTMVLNSEAFALMRQATRNHGFVSHDWTAYQLVTGSGGIVHYDPEPAILYRVHHLNVVGPNTGVLATLSRVLAALRGRFVAWNNTNLVLLDASYNQLTAENRKLFDLFRKARIGRLYQRIRCLRKAGLYRQATRGDVSLWIACLLNRL